MFVIDLNTTLDCIYDVLKDILDIRAGNRASLKTFSGFWRVKTSSSICSHKHE